MRWNQMDAGMKTISMIRVFVDAPLAAWLFYRVELCLYFFGFRVIELDRFLVSFSGLRLLPSSR